VPRYVGRDAVLRYDPRAADWPEGPALLMAACLAGVTLAAERGDRVRVVPSSIEDAFDGVSQALGRILIPPEAREAQRRGRRALDAGDLVLAEASFDEACRLGLHDDETRLWRGWARLGLGRFDAATADLDAVLGRDPAAGPPGDWRPIAAYLRAVLREAEGDLAGALRDIELAVALGLTGAEVRDKRAALAARLAS
jgi:tetratricopeptide (TPR) repeat protein